MLNIYWSDRKVDWGIKIKEERKKKRQKNEIDRRGNKKKERTA